MNPIFQRASLGAGILFVALGAQAQVPGATSAPSGGQQAAAGNGAGKADLASGDRTFMNQAAIANLAEVEMGRLAQDKAQSDEVKRFARHMVDDHAKAYQELASVAQGKGVDLPRDVDRAHKSSADKLAKLSGREFDQAFMKQMVKDHEKTVGDFRKAAKNARDPAVKGYAEAKLPALEEHLRMAQATEKSVGRDRTAMRGQP